MAIVSGGEPPFLTLRLSRLNDLSGNLSASQSEDTILEAFNAAKTAQARESQDKEGWFTPLTAAKFNSRVLAQAFRGASEFRKALFISESLILQAIHFN